MDKRLIVLVAACFGGCDQAADIAAPGNSAGNSAAASKPRAAYCFFKDAETRGWSASRDSSGNVVVKGQAYRSDPRYQAQLGPAEVTGDKATLSPTIQPNATGFAAPENWWDVSATIPGSAAVKTVTVRCGKKTIAELELR